MGFQVFVEQGLPFWLLLLLWAQGERREDSKAVPCAECPQRGCLGAVKWHILALVSGEVGGLLSRLVWLLKNTVCGSVN